MKELVMFALELVEAFCFGAMVGAGVKWLVEDGCSFRSKDNEKENDDEPFY